MISFWFALYFLCRFIGEFYKVHQVFRQGQVLDMGQYLSMPGFLIGVVGLIVAFKRKVPAGWYEEYTEEERAPKKKAFRDPDVDAQFGSGRAKPKKKKKKRAKKATSTKAASTAPTSSEEKADNEAPVSEAPESEAPDSTPPASSDDDDSNANPPK